MSEINLTKNQLIVWEKNKLTNPVTKRKIKENGPVYKKIKKQFDKVMKKKNDNYEYYRRNKIDPILLTELPLNNMLEKNVFKYEYKWNPYTGKKLNIKDESGPLCFDPNSLIHYFYKNRLNNLWKKGEYNEDENIYTEGYYGDALGGYPDFSITGRGKHPEMYLFRLPIIDCYLEKDHNLQVVTMGPELSNKEIKKINSLSNKDVFKSLYKYKKPNILKLKNIYDKAVDSLHEYNTDNNDLSIEDNNNIKYQINTDAVKSLITFR